MNLAAALRRIALTILSAIALTACALMGMTFDEYKGYDPALSFNRYGVSGTIYGLDGAEATVLLNHVDGSRVGPDGRFAFPKMLIDGATYDVTVESDRHTCDQWSGQIPGADVTDVAIRCVSKDATLTTLFVSGSPTMSPAFAAERCTNGCTDKGEYRAFVSSVLPATIASVTATARAPGAQIACRVGNAEVPAAAVPILPSPGETPIDVVVTAPDHVTQRVYRIVVTGDPGAYLKASNARRDSAFGSSVALSGDTLVVGASTESSGAMGINGDQTDTSAPGSGAVYVFVRTGLGWSQQAYIKASNTYTLARFGSSVALSGDTLVVGAPSETSYATGINGDQTDRSKADAGAVYVFVRTGTVWSQQAYIKGSNTQVGGFFGDDVALAGETLAVGSANETSNSMLQAGAVYVFARSGSAWSQQAYLQASNARAFARFGASVALSEDMLAVGADGESSSAKGVNGDQADILAPSAGAAYVFTRAGTTWSQQAYVKASNTAPSQSFGTSVALSGDTLAVGAKAESSHAAGVNGDQLDRSTSYAGAAYVFTRLGTTWAQQAYVKASNPQESAEFGCSVAVEGDTLAIGARGEASNAKSVNGNQLDTSLTNAGAAYVFTRTGSVWVQRAYVKALNSRQDAQFGLAIALSGNTVAVGALRESSGVIGDPSNDTAPGAGAAYWFR